MWLQVVPHCRRGLTELVAHLNQPLNRPWVQLTTSWALSFGWSNHIQAHCSGYQLLFHSFSHWLLDQMASANFPAADQDLLDCCLNQIFLMPSIGVTLLCCCHTWNGGCRTPELERGTQSMIWPACSWSIQMDSFKSASSDYYRLQSVPFGICTLSIQHLHFWASTLLLHIVHFICYSAS